MLQDLVNDYDAIFLLIDIRYSRCIPTLMDRDLVKTLTNVALEQDGWIYMQHGISRIVSDRLGYYFYIP